MMQHEAPSFIHYNFQSKIYNLNGFGLRNQLLIYRKYRIQEEVKQGSNETNLEGETIFRTAGFVHSTNKCPGKGAVID